MNALRDNFKNGTVGDFLKEFITPGSKLSFVSAYFTIYAYHQLKAQLDGIDSLRFLFGEPTFVSSIDPDKSNRREFKIEDDQLVVPIANRLNQKSIAKECAQWIEDKVEVKSMVKPNFLHGKLYHLESLNGTKESIMGSSNLTVSGLGLGGRHNIELNMVIQDRRDAIELEEWFNTLWSNEDGLVEDVKQKVLTYLHQFYLENEPEFIYFKTLYHVFDKFLREQETGGLLKKQIGFFESEIWNMLYDFQKDGVKGAINKILKHNGCIIADSVGLGKTFEALAVIRYFELLNCRVLVLCPKKLSGNWTVYQASQNSTLNPFRKDRFNYTVLYHTDLGRDRGVSDANGVNLENFNWGAYDLVVIDESHNFRGNPMERVSASGVVRFNRAKWLMDKIIKTGVKTKVLLLSATPVNNNLRDLRNQLLLITEGRKDALFESTQVRNIELALRNAQTQFTNWADRKRNPDRSVKQLLEKLDSSFFKLLDEMTIARSRKHIMSYYDISAIGRFSERLKPHAIYPNIDLKDRFFTYDALNKKILEYKLSVFNPSAYIKPGLESKYEELGGTQVLAFTQSDRESFLIGMMKVNYLKRLESSVESFEISLDRTIQKIESLEQRIALFKVASIVDTEVGTGEAQPDDDELEEIAEDLEQWQVGKKFKYSMADLQLDDWLTDLSADKQALSDIYNNAVAVTPDRDAKLKALKDVITAKMYHPLNGTNDKVIVFTAFADTAQYLYDCMKGWAKDVLGKHIALVVGSGSQTSFGKNDFGSILTNFSPVSKIRARMPSMPQDGEISILIATDCISEGQNLQDCDFMVNYDIHWNPVRIIQRFGRIDRLGSTNAKIQLVNFWPTEDLDNYINLKERVEARMALVDVTATGEDNILNTEQIEELIEEDLKYRNQQLKRLRDEVLDLEDMNESLTLTDFTLDDFRIELMNYIESNRKRLEDAPFGLYAVVPSPFQDNSEILDLRRYSEAEKAIIRPGVVYCLRQKGDTEGNEEVNPLQPYFLVYIWNDGQVRFNYANGKQILEIYRLMCQGKTEPFNSLCQSFNDETGNGRNMDQYSEMLRKAVEDIIRVFRKRMTQRLTTDRAGLIFPKSKQIDELNNFELVSWLIIR